MRRLLALLLLTLLPGPVFAQKSNWFSTKAQQEFQKALTDASFFGVPRYTTALLPTCNTANKGAVAYDTTLSAFVVCSGSAWGSPASGTIAGPIVFTPGVVTFGTAQDAANSVMLNDTAGCITFEGATADAFENKLCTADPTVGDRTFNLPNIAAAGTSTLATLETAQTFSGVQTLSGGGLVSGGNFILNNGLVFVVGTTAGQAGSISLQTANTPDQDFFATGSTSNSWHIAEAADVGTDFNNCVGGTAATTDPQFCVHSHNQDTTQYTAVSAFGTSGGMRKTLTESSATAVVQIPVAASAGTGGTFSYCVFAADASDQQERCGRIKFAVTNKAATETCGLTTDAALVTDASITETEDGNASSISAGTLTYAIACDTAPTNAANITINAVSSLTQSTLEARYSVNLIGPGQVTPQ